MTYAKGILTGLAAILLAEFVPGSSAFRVISTEKARGPVVLSGGLAGSLFSPLFWIIAALFFVFFSWASRLDSKLLRALLFWIPTVTVSTFGFTITAVITYLRFRNH